MAGGHAGAMRPVHWRLERLSVISLELTLCKFCARSRPDFLRALAQLQAAYPHDIVVEELDCMAACDDVPAIMVDTEFYPRCTPRELINAVQRRLQSQSAAAD